MHPDEVQAVHLPLYASDKVKACEVSSWGDVYQAISGCLQAYFAGFRLFGSIMTLVNSDIKGNLSRLEVFQWVCVYWEVFQCVATMDGGEEEARKL